MACAPEVELTHVSHIQLRLCWMLQHSNEISYTLNNVVTKMRAMLLWKPQEINKSKCNSSIRSGWATCQGRRYRGGLQATTAHKQALLIVLCDPGGVTSFSGLHFPVCTVSAVC